MKQLPIHNPSFEHLLFAFGEWLSILDYAPATAKQLPSFSREFIHYLETTAELKAIAKLEAKHIRTYYNYLLGRRNTKYGGALQENSINMHILSINKFLEFLRHKGLHDLPLSGLKRFKVSKTDQTVLTESEVQSLFRAANNYKDQPRYEAISARDKALLAVFYGCGLRRTEGLKLTLTDINFDTSVLHVRKGKGYKERFVPMSKAVGKHLEHYIYNYRSWFLKYTGQDALFLSTQGHELSSCGVYLRLRSLQELSEDIGLQQKQLTIHCLRHSIATHLLGSGMELQKVQRFLGHTSLESTQIYTHLLEKENTNQTA